jgi:quinoprotein glucose dehydrogenase
VAAQPGWRRGAAIAGLGLLASGILLFGNRRSGALLYALVFIGTLLWTWWESGSDYWRWVPRLGLDRAWHRCWRCWRPPSTNRSPAPVAQRGGRADAGVRGRLRPGVAPHGEVDGHQPFPEGAVSAGLEPTRDTTGLQPADQPAEGDWPAWGRSMPPPAIAAAADHPGQRGTLQPQAFRNRRYAEEALGRETPLKIGDRLYLCRPQPPDRT